MAGDVRTQPVRNKALSWLGPIGVLLIVVAGPARAADLLSQARAEYNRGQYEIAVELATQAKAIPTQADAANLVLARALLERYRQSADSAHLDEARAALTAIRPATLSARERIEFVIGLGEALYLEDAFGAAAEMFSLAMARAGEVGPAARERVLDWWASALDRRAQQTPGDDRTAIYRRIVTRMEEELARDAASAAAGYWLAAAARGAGDLERAWSAAVAAWIRARLTPAHGATLRTDLDRVVLEAIIPDRARQHPEPRRTQAADEMRAEWQRVKERWK
ncbi:MAG: hypothetical protein HY654_06060 [Acidobacteria bacterium]|nr:hypothetical protein [Acidobacteriota bacterium]